MRAIKINNAKNLFLKLKSHIQTNHESLKNLKCELCKLTFSEYYDSHRNANIVKKNLKSHIQTIHVGHKIFANKNIF